VDVSDRPYDIAVIGGGVNGCGIARDAAGRGLSVFLAEQGDLASGTSSASTKLIHGGLRYLEYYEFKLVREALIEREVLLSAAPHIIWPMRFVLPHLEGLRPAWLIRLGLFLYDHLGGRKILPPCRSLDLRRDPAGEPLKPGFRKAFEYSDCWVDDARLVVLNAVDAARLGADIRTRTEILTARRSGGLWHIEAENKLTGNRETVTARLLVNAAGPWIADVISHRIVSEARAHTRLVKGSHIVVPRIFAHDRAYIFQNRDRRIIFAIPYEGDFTLIGTTDVDFQGDPSAAAASDDEIAYLCGAASEYFAKPIRPADVVWTYSGVRPLYDDGSSAAQAATRDYVLELDGDEGEPPLLNIFGGKITTYRHLAEDALAKLSRWLGNAGGPWTQDASLPGGDFPVDGFEELVSELTSGHVAADPALVRRLARAYGVDASKILAAEQGIHFGAGLWQSEVVYLLRTEWAVTAEDILWRRSKLGLWLTREEAGRLQEWIEENRRKVTGPAF
jgi:glycerol-3-phosphate dehydrogenase